MSPTGRLLALAMCVSVVVIVSELAAAPVLSIDPADVRTVVIDDFNDGAFTPNSESPTGAFTFTESDGTLNGTIAASTGDPHFRIPSGSLSIDATRYSYFRMRENSDYNGTLQVFYSGPAAGESEPRSSVFSNIGATDGYIERRSIFKLPALSPASTVSRVRFDPISATSTTEASFNYDYFIVDQYDTIGLGEFDHQADQQGWSTGHTSSATVAASLLSGVAADNDPQVYRYDAAINADKYKYLEIRMQRDTGTGAEMFWGASGFAGERRLNLGVTGTDDGEYHVYWIDMRNEDTWTGTINALRVDPATTSGKTFDIDYIRLVEGPSGGAWTNTAGGSWLQNANWSGGLIANGANSTADFSTLDLTANATVTVDTQRVIGHLLFGDTAAEGSPQTYKSWTLNADTAGALVMDVDSGAPTITVGNGAATINVAIAGSRGLTKTGAGRLTLSGANVYSGETTIEDNSILTISNANALGSATDGTTVASGSQLRLEGGLTFAAEPLTISGRGVEPCNPTELRGALRSHSGANVWTGPITVSSSAWISSVGGSTGSITITGGVTGSGASLRLDQGTQTVTTNPINLGTTGTLSVNSSTLLDVAGNDFGNLWIDWGGNLRFGAADALPAYVSVRMGTTDGTSAGRGTLNLNGYDQTIGRLADGGTNYAEEVITNSQTALATLTINQSANSTYQGKITGNLALTKQGSGTLTLGGDNTYVGATTVAGGTLALATAGTNNLSGSPLVTVGQNGVLNVTGVTGTGGFALATGQTVKGSGTILGDMTVAAGSTVSPGMSPGTLIHTGNETWIGGGAYDWEIEDADADPGTGWDMLNISGSLTVEATPSSPFLIDIHTLWASGAFDPPVNYQWEIATASGGIVGFEESSFSLLTSGADLPEGSSVFITMAGNSLFVNYLVPEPSTIILLVFAFLAGMSRFSRKRPC